MYPVTEDFKVAVRYSHQVITRAEILRDDQLIGIIYPESGSVEIDARRAQRRTCSVTLHDTGRTLVYTPVFNSYASLETTYASYAAFASAVAIYANSKVVIDQELEVDSDGLIPDSGLDLLTPYGNEIRLFRGIRYRKNGSVYAYASLSALYASYGDLLASVSTYGSISVQDSAVVTLEEYVPLGTFRITDVTISQDTSGVSIDIDGIDRAIRISNNRWIEPYQIASGTNLATALTDLLQNRWTDIPLRFGTTTATTSAITLGLDTENDPWADAQTIAEAAGYDLYFDSNGYCVLEQVTDYSVAASSEQYLENEEAMILTTDRTLSSDGVYNAVVVTGEGSRATPFRSIAIDSNPASPTYAYGPFGLVPTFRSSPLITSQASADAYALATLSQLQGKDESISWNQIVDPSLDVGDVISIVNVTSKIARALVLDRLSIPLGSDAPMAAQGRTIVYQSGDTIVTASGETVAVIPPTTTSPIVRAQSVQ